MGHGRTCAVAAGSTSLAAWPQLEDSKARKPHHCLNLLRLAQLERPPKRLRSETRTNKGAPPQLPLHLLLPFPFASWALPPKMLRGKRWCASLTGRSSLVHVVIPSLVHVLYPSLVHVGRSGDKWLKQKEPPRLQNVGELHRINRQNIVDVI